MACRHCQKKRVNRPLGLCWSCYYTPGVRVQYGGQASLEKRDDYSQSKTPRQTLSSLPGSTERIRALRERVLRGEATWRKGDAGFGTLD